MWEFWRSKLSKGKTRHKRRDLDTGSDEDSPSTVRSMELTDTGMPGTSPENSSHGRCLSLFVIRSARVGVGCKASKHKSCGHAVYFKDIILPASDDDDEDESEDVQSDVLSDTAGPERNSTDEPQPDLGTLTTQKSKRNLGTQRSKRIHRVDRQKLIIILVGLPGRGKTFLCNKLMCYLNW